MLNVDRATRMQNESNCLCEEFFKPPEQQEPQAHSFFSSEHLGVSLVVFGIVTIALAAWRYNQVFWQIERGNYRPDRSIVWLMTAVVMVLGLLSIPLLLSRNRLPSVPSTPIKPQSRQPF